MDGRNITKALQNLIPCLTLKCTRAKNLPQPFLLMPLLMLFMLPKMLSSQFSHLWKIFPGKSLQSEHGAPPLAS